MRDIRLLIVPEVAKLLRVPPSRAYQLIRDGDLPAVHVGRQLRVSEEALRNWIAEGGDPLPPHPAPPDENARSPRREELKEEAQRRLRDAEQEAERLGGLRGEIRPAQRHVSAEIDHALAELDALEEQQP